MMHNRRDNVVEGDAMISRERERTDMHAYRARETWGRTILKFVLTFLRHRRREPARAGALSTKWRDTIRKQALTSVMMMIVA